MAFRSRSVSCYEIPLQDVVADWGGWRWLNAWRERAHSTSVPLRLTDRDDVLVDCSDYATISIRELRSIMRLARVVEAKGARLSLVNATPAVCVLAEIVRLDEVIPVRPVLATELATPS